MDKPSGWRNSKEFDSKFWTRKTKWGVKYKCRECYRETLGKCSGVDIVNMHYPHCRHRIEFEMKQMDAKENGVGNV